MREAEHARLAPLDRLASLGVEDLPEVELGVEVHHRLLVALEERVAQLGGAVALYYLDVRRADLLELALELVTVLVGEGLRRQHGVLHRVRLGGDASLDHLDGGLEPVGHVGRDRDVQVKRHHARDDDLPLGGDGLAAAGVEDAEPVVHGELTEHHLEESQVRQRREHVERAHAGIPAEQI